jgi:hypothetical protein
MTPYLAALGPAPPPSPQPRPGEADVIIIIARPDRPSSIVARTGICEQQFREKEMATAPPATSPSNRAAGCRCTNQADRAGRADQSASRRPASRARE